MELSKILERINITLSEYEYDYMSRIRLPVTFVRVQITMLCPFDAA